MARTIFTVHFSVRSQIQGKKGRNGAGNPGNANVWLSLPVLLCYENEEELCWLEGAFSGLKESHTLTNPSERSRGHRRTSAGKGPLPKLWQSHLHLLGSTWLPSQLCLLGFSCCRELHLLSVKGNLKWTRCLQKLRELWTQRPLQAK